MLNFIDGVRGSVRGNVQTTDAAITVSAPITKKLKSMRDGEHIYLTISYLDRSEVVKFTKDGEIRNNTLRIERDQLGAGRKNFPCGSCIVAEWNSIQLQEFICLAKGACNDLHA